MARVMRMPSEADLPPGTKRDVVELLFELYRAARRPTLREISRKISDGDYRATASQETIRKMLHGTTVPANWETMEAVCSVLCDMAGWNLRTRLDLDGSTQAIGGHALDRWHRALDEPDGRYGQPVKANGQADDPWGQADDPWATGGSDGDGLSDEPPF